MKETLSKPNSGGTIDKLTYSYEGQFQQTQDRGSIHLVFVCHAFYDCNTWRFHWLLDFCAFDGRRSRFDLKLK